VIRAKLSPKAEHDLDDACNYISSDNPEAAARVRHTILETADFLAEHHGIGRLIRDARPRHAHIRFFVIPKFRNYLIFYLPVHETITVVRILHASQDWTRFFPNSK